MKNFAGLILLLLLIFPQYSIAEPALRGIELTGSLPILEEIIPRLAEQLDIDVERTILIETQNEMLTVSIPMSDTESSGGDTALLASLPPMIIDCSLAPPSGSLPVFSPEFKVEPLEFEIPPDPGYSPFMRIKRKGVLDKLLGLCPEPPGVAGDIFRGVTQHGYYGKSQNGTSLFGLQFRF